MVLEEAKQLLLVGKVSTQMKPNALCVFMLQTIIEALVVTEVEPPLLQLPLQIPVSLGNKEKVRMRSRDGRNRVSPVFGWRPLPCTTAPGAFEDLVQQKHGHVATDAITLSRDTGDSLDHCLPKSGLKRIELQNIRPSREVGATAAGEDISLYHNVGCRLVSSIIGISANEILGVFGDPRVIRRNMIRNEVQEQLHASLRELLPGDGEAFRAAEVFINYVASYAVGRSDIVFWLKVGQSSAEVVNQILVLIGNRDARRASLPNAHEPDGVEAELGDGVPFG